MNIIILSCLLFSYVSLAADVNPWILKKFDLPEKIKFNHYYSYASMEASSPQKTRLKSVLIEKSIYNAPQKRTERISICFKGHPEFMQEFERQLKEEYENGKEDITIEDEGSYVVYRGREYDQVKIMNLIFPLESAESVLHHLKYKENIFDEKERTQLEKLFDLIST